MAVRTDLRRQTLSHSGEIIALAHEYRARNLSVRFPDYEFEDMPEVEFIADMDDGTSLFDRANLVMALNDLLGAATHVFLRDELPGDFAESLERDAVALG
ncbi:MAG: hypothetical protein WEB00_15145 [Dehalococcoidia bacterium]